MNWNSVQCTVRNKIFCIVLTRAATAGQKPLVPVSRAKRTNQGRAPFICTLWVPVCLSFNSQQRPPLSVSSLSVPDTAYSFAEEAISEILKFCRLTAHTEQLKKLTSPMPTNRRRWFWTKRILESIVRKSLQIPILFDCLLINVHSNTPCGN